MKKLFTVVFTMLLAGSLAFAQATSTTDTKAGEKTATTTTAKKKSAKKSHKGSKKKKGSTEAAPAQPAK